MYYLGVGMPGCSEIPFQIVSHQICWLDVSCSELPDCHCQSDYFPVDKERQPQQTGRSTMPERTIEAEDDE